MRSCLVVTAAFVALALPSHAAAGDAPAIMAQAGHVFRSPGDIGPRYEPDVDRLWAGYRRTGCYPVARAVRLRSGGYRVRTTLQCPRRRR